WMASRPVAVSARLETRRHTAWAVEDTAALSLVFSGATAEVLLTWAADERRNFAAITGESGRLALGDDVLVLARGAHEERRGGGPGSCPRRGGGSHPPEGLGAVMDAFLPGVGGRWPAGVNLAEACLCVAVETLARESSRRGGETLVLPVSPAPRASRPVPSGP